ncbi:MAG: sigma-54-dependent transcriptional regulator [Candidatus Rokuibacteriota bacterium]
MTIQPRILVVDDDEAIRAVLRDSLALWGYHATTASDGVEALELIKSELFDAVLLDIRMPKMDGLELLREIRRYDVSIPVVMMTGDPTVETAVEALKQGAYDYLQKPFMAEEVRHLMGRLMERRLLSREVHSLRSRLGAELAVKELVGVSPDIERVKDIATKVAATDSPVLIEGESGTGKEVVAATIHRLSARNAGPFIPVNCGAIPTDLLESEFFGHVRGAFSGAVADTLGLFRSAHGGTLFLDEVAELPPALQVKLLRVLQDREIRPVGSTKTHAVDLRVIAATNRPVEEALKDGSLRQDLFYRLNVVRIVLSPLRERKVDIPVLLTNILRQLNERFGREITGIRPDAIAALATYDFPGNVRELENLLERAYALGARGEITLADLPALPSRTQAPATSGELPTLVQAERELILRALHLYENDRDQAARALGISRRTIYRRLKEYGVL